MISVNKQFLLASQEKEAMDSWQCWSQNSGDVHIHIQQCKEQWLPALPLLTMTAMILWTHCAAPSLLNT